MNGNCSSAEHSVNDTATIAASSKASSNGPLPAKGSSAGSDNAANDDETDDECCIYTYKGDSRVADLPSSFFTFDQGDSLSSADESCGAAALPQRRRRSGFNGLDGHGQSPSSSGSVAARHSPNRTGSGIVTFSGRQPNGSAAREPPPGDLFSPEMDFLEMDFDPGGFGDDEDEYRSEEDGIPDFNQGGWNSNQLESNLAACAPTSQIPAQLPCHEVDVTDGVPSSSQIPGPSRILGDIAKASPTSARSNVIVSPRQQPSSNIVQLSARVSAIPVVDSAAPLQSFAHLPYRNDQIPSHFEPGSSHLNPQLLLGTPEPHSSTTRAPSRQLLMRLVKSSTLPEMRSHSIQELSSEGASNEVARESGVRITRNQCLSNSDPLIKNEPCFRAIINPSSKSATDDDPIEFEVGGVMIWSEEEASQRSLCQIGTSACGATAVCNVLKALGFDTIDPAYVNSCVKTRLRNNGAEIPEYLFSRSNAGATHEDLLQGTVEASKGLVNGRFFQPKPGTSPRGFCKWLLHWICKGAVPVVTRNMQVLRPDQVGHQIPDAWHHQMIFGISPDKIFLTNPVERESPSAILPQLTSPSVLLVRRSDVIDRKTPTTDLRTLARHPNPEWAELNVLGQVANIILEEIPVFSSNSIAKRIRTTHVTIPAGYKGGVTLFMPTNSPSFSLLLEAPEL